MPYDKFAEAFVDENGTPLGGDIVPESCIDSAEWIIRVIKTGKVTRSKISMYAKFANITFNASEDDFMNSKTLPQDYNFSGLPKLGQGIVLLSKTFTDLTYNMHFGAILAWSPDQAVISHMFAFVKNPPMKPLIVTTITSADDFRIQTFGEKDAKLYAAGLLTA